MLNNTHIFNMPIIKRRGKIIKIFIIICATKYYFVSLL